MNDLKLIKKYYGENFMHLCRELFPTLLEIDGLLFGLIESKFAYSKFLYDDITNYHLEYKFKNYIYSLTNSPKNEYTTIKHPKELLNEVGYNLYECKINSDIQEFRKFYEKSEELCTFHVNRLESCYVFFAVKKNVDEIKREDFPIPARQDEYGTSVISIQFSRGKNNTLSIKNRYNHTVLNPDATFSNNLENIIPGLTKSFERFYILNINQNELENFEIPYYVKASDGKFYKYNYEINNVYYCPDNIIIDNFKVRKDWQIEKEKYIIVDYFILDLVKKEIYLYDKRIFDSFPKGLKNISKIEIIKNKENKNKTIKIIFNNQTNCFIKIDERNNIVSYENEHLTTIGNRFMSYNRTLKEINIPNILTIGDDFLYFNNIIKKINFPNLIYIGDNFLSDNKILRIVNLTSVEYIKNNFLFDARVLETICLPEVIEIGDNFLRRNDKVRCVNFPKLKKVGNNFFATNEQIEKIEFENLEQIGNDFLYSNSGLSEIKIPKIWCVGHNFLERNRNLRKVKFDNLTDIGDYFMYYNDLIEKINLPLAKTIGKDFMPNNIALRKFSAKNLETIDERFLYNNKCLTILDIPNIKIISDDFLFKNQELKVLIFPELVVVGDYFLDKNKKLEYLYAPKLESTGDYFISHNQNYKILNLLEKESIKKLSLVPNKTYI